MDTKTIFAIVLLALAGSGGVLVLLYYFRSNKPDGMRSMMPSVAGVQDYTTGVGGQSIDAIELEKIKVEARQRRRVTNSDVTLEERIFRAGIFSEKEKADFYRLRIFCPIVIMPLLGAFIWSLAGAKLGMMGMLLGAVIGYQLPFSILDRRIAWRNEEIMFYLPLVIEQISIGVSSSLDIGPCLQRVVQMADERDTHNVVTELVKYAQNYIKSGVPFEEAMVETGKASGQTELKHAFMYLAQVAKHGGEITRQLQELADSVSAQRQAYIEGKIKKLELLATGPVSLVFLGFLIILLIGFGVQLKNAF